MLWTLPAVHVAVSAISGYYYVRHMFALAAAFSLGWEPPAAPLAQIFFWLFNMPCLLVVTLLSGIVPASWQPQEYTRMWVVQPAVLALCAVANTGIWFWLGAQWEEPGPRITWWRTGLAVLAVAMAAGILLHSGKPDVQVLPFLLWLLLLAGWAMRVSAPRVSGRGN